MLTTRTNEFSTTYLCEEIARLSALKKPKKLLLLLPVALIISSCYQLLSGVEYAGQDPVIRGPRIFSWLKKLLPARPRNIEDEQTHPKLKLFENGIDSITPVSIRQNGVYDCRFLAALTSFAVSPRGKNTIFNMVKANADDTYTVVFPGARNEPITVSPLTGLELRIYSKASTDDGDSAGVWLPVVEKAYGTYLIRHQSLQEKVFHTIRHAVFEGRWDAAPELPGFAASWGAKDERGCVILTGHDMDQLATASLEIGDFGLGKGYVTARQISSWFNRDWALSQFYDEQKTRLREAFRNQKIVTATTGIEANAEAHGLMNHHAYAVVGYDEANARILIRDVLCGSFFVAGTEPVEFEESQKTKPFWVPLSGFNKCFSELSVERT